MNTPEDLPELPVLLKAPAGRARAVSALFQGEHAPQLVKRRVIQSMRQVHGALEEAQQEAKGIVERANEEAAGIRQAAYDEGYEEGIRQLTRALASARNEYDRMLAQSEEDMLELAVRMAERIVRRQIELAPESVAAIARGCLELVRERRQIIIYANPLDVPQLEAWREDLTQSVEARSLHFEPDPQIGRGGCMIETEAGRVDARLDVQLDSFKRALLS